MESNNNKYKPETDFEKERFSKLIENMQKLKEEEVSEEFDNKFFKELNKVKPIELFSLKIKKYLHQRFEKNRIKILTLTTVVTAVVLVVVILAIRQNQQNENNLAVQKDTSQTNLERDKVKSLDTRLHQNISEENRLETETPYWKEIMRDLDQKYGLSLSERKNSIQLIKEIIESNLVKKSLAEMKNPNRDDTLKLLHQLLRKDKK